jgi:hypothetical protein
MERFPDEPEFQRLFAINQHTHGLMLLNQGRFDEAEELFLTALALRESLTDLKPVDHEFRRDLIRSHLDLARLAFSRPDSNSANRNIHLESAVRLNEQLIRDFGAHMSSNDISSQFRELQTRTLNSEHE